MATRKRTADDDPFDKYSTENDPFDKVPAPPGNVELQPVHNGVRVARDEAREDGVSEASEAEPPALAKPSHSARKVVLAIVFYSLAASGMMIVNKLCMKEAHLPSFFGILQFAAAALTVLILSAAGACPRDDVTLRWSRVKPYLLYSFIFVAVIYSNMQALLYSSIATVIVFRSIVPLFVCVLDWAFLGRQLPSKRSLLALMAVAASAIGYVAADKEFEMRGAAAYTWVAIYTLFLSIEMAYAKHIVGPQLGFKSIWGPVFHNNLLSIGTIAVLMLITKEQVELARTSWSVRLCVYVGLSCAMSVVISYAGWKCRSLISASSFTVVGVANKMLTVLANSLIWDDHLSWFGAMCLFSCLVAACSYRQAPMRGTPSQEVAPTSLVSELIAALRVTRFAAQRYLDLGEGSDSVEAPPQHDVQAAAETIRNNFLEPLRARASALDVFICANVRVEPTSYGASQQLITSDAYVGVRDLHVQQFRIHDCFQHLPPAARQGGDFFIRIRPDAHFFRDSVPPPSYWPQDRLALRFRSYYNDHPLPNTCRSFWGNDIYLPPGQIIMADDQMWIAPRSVADAAFSTEYGDNWPAADALCALDWAECALTRLWASRNVELSPAPFNFRLQHSQYGVSFEASGALHDEQHPVLECFPPTPPLAPPVSALDEIGVVAATLSSTYAPFTASNCIDGNLNNFCHSGDQGDQKSNPWLSLEAVSPGVVSYVWILNRGGECCQEWLGSFELWVGDVAGGAHAAPATRCASFVAPATPGPFMVSCGVAGRFLTLVLPGADRLISLAEVRLYNMPTPPVPPALPQPPQIPGPAYDFAAICLSGQVRTFLDVHQTIRERLVDPFEQAGGAQVFMHVSLASSYPSYHPWLPQGEWTITRQQLQPAIDNLKPTTLDIYPEHVGSGSYLQDAATMAPSTCYQAPGEAECCHWSYHGRQFWGIFKCFQLIEQAEKSMTRPFQFAIRYRPDAIPAPQVVDLIREIVQEPESANSVLMSDSTGADAFMIGQGRNGIRAVQTIWEEFTGSCLDPAFPDMPSSIGLCSPFNVEWTSTECLILRHIHATGVNLRRDSRVHVASFLRPVSPENPSWTRDCAPSC